MHISFSSHGESESTNWNSGKHKVPVLEITEVKLNGLDLDILEGQAAQRCLCLFSSFFELVSFSINYAS